MGKRYTALRVIGMIYRILGIITLALTIIAVIGICGMAITGGSAIDAIARQYGGESSGTGVVSGIMVGGIFSFIAIISGGLTSITLFAFGEGIYLLISIEENTRKTAFVIENPK